MAHEQSVETDIALLVQKQAQMEEHIKATDEALIKECGENAAAIKALQDERNKALIWGIITLGTMVIGMGGWMIKIFITLFSHGSPE